MNVSPSTTAVNLDAGMVSRAQGCLLGQLAGDSLGGLVEFQETAAIRSGYPRGLRDLANGGCWSNLAGQPTDDSELALALARTLVLIGRYDEGEVLEAYVRWYKDPQTFDIGGTIGRALRAAAAASNPSDRLRRVSQEASQTSQANGALMRVSPVGIFCAGRPQAAADVARRDSLLTHPHRACVDASAVYVAAIATAIAKGGAPADCHAAALAEADRTHVAPEIRNALTAASHSPATSYDGDNMGWVLIALQNAFYQLLHAPNLEEGIVDTVMRGGDTDTNGAIAGALLGAVHGRENVPERWVQTLLKCRPGAGSATRHPRRLEYWPVDALELAEALLRAGLRSPLQLS